MLNICVMFMITTIPGVGLLSKECKAPIDNIWGVEYYEPRDVVIVEDLEEALYFSDAFYYAPSLYYARNSVYPTRYSKWRFKRKVRRAPSVRTTHVRSHAKKRKKRLRRKNRQLRKRNRHLRQENRRLQNRRGTTARNVFQGQRERRVRNRTTDRSQRQNRRAERNRNGRRSSRQ